MTTSPFVNWLGPLDGAEIAGGCDFCDAYQTVSVDAPGCWALITHHDDWCPQWTAIRAERKRRRK